MKFKVKREELSFFGKEFLIEGIPEIIELEGEPICFSLYKKKDCTCFCSENYKCTCHQEEKPIASGEFKITIPKNKKVKKEKFITKVWHILQKNYKWMK